MASAVARLPLGAALSAVLEAPSARSAAAGLAQRPGDAADLQAACLAQRHQGGREDRMVGVEAVGHQVQLAAVELRGQLEARHRGDAVLLQRGREPGGPLDRVVVGQRRVADAAGGQRRRQRLGRLLAVAEDRVGVEVDVRTAPTASRWRPARSRPARRSLGREVAGWPRHGRATPSPAPASASAARPRPA